MHSPSFTAGTLRQLVIPLSFGRVQIERCVRRTFLFLPRSGVGRDGGGGRRKRRKRRRRRKMMKCVYIHAGSIGVEVVDGSGWESVVGREGF